MRTCLGGASGEGGRGKERAGEHTWRRQTRLAQPAHCSRRTLDILIFRPLRAPSTRPNNGSFRPGATTATLSSSYPLLRRLPLSYEHKRTLSSASINVRLLTSTSPQTILPTSRACMFAFSDRIIPLWPSVCAYRRLPDGPLHWSRPLTYTHSTFYHPEF